MVNEDIASTQEGQPQTVIPSYELIKRNILWCWFDIQTEYEKFKKITLRAQDYNFSPLTSKLISLYSTMLRPKIKKIWKNKDKTDRPEDFIKKMDKFVEEGIEKKEVDEVIRITAQFLEDSNLTNISFEGLPWDKRFEHSYL